MRAIIRLLDFLSPLADLAIRLWVANVFWKSGLNKYQSMDTTKMLFEHEYQVPALSPDVAAYLATGVELIFPVLLAIGLMGRFSAGVLFVFNIIAVISYPSLNPAGLVDHYVWGIMLLIPFLHGPGKISVDHFIRQRYMD
ncbi:MAG: DoxX family protein [Thiohalobacterales bacterium]|nr:DoxX family protein [Thiohalobacterales bacterium]